MSYQIADAIQSPGLRVRVTYLRPTDRSELLTQLVQLGCFVSEADEFDRVTTQTSNHDLNIVFVVGSAAEQGTLATLAKGSTVLGVTAAGCRASADVPTEVVWTTEEPREFRDALTSAARNARARREKEESANHSNADGVTVCRFPPALQRSGRTVPLSDDECAFLVRLIAAKGSPVPAAEAEASHRESRASQLADALRRKLAAVGADPSVLGSVRGLGYVLRR